MAMTPERKLKKITINLMRSPLFADFSGILMLGKKYVVDNCPTAATDGRDEWYGRGFIEMMDEKMLGFVVLHEGAHKLLRQLTVWKKLFLDDASLANQAADYVVNGMLHKRDPQGTVISIPQINGKNFICLDKRFDGMNTKQVFDILKQEKQGKGAQGNQPGNGQPGQGGQPGNGNAPGETLDHHDWKGANGLNKEEKEQLEKEIDQAIRQGQITAQKFAGKNGGDLNRELMDLLDPKVDWREVLREFVSSTCAGRDMATWRRPNRRFLSEDIIMPSLVSERVDCVVVGSDTSGSISNEEHARNISEADGILSQVIPETLHMIYWDAKVQGHELYNDSNRESFKTSTKPKGGGGTDPTAMMRYLKQSNIKPDCIIMFTDGCIGDWGNEWECPILWIITGSYGRNITAPVGKTVHIE